MKVVCIYSQKDKKHYESLYEHLHYSRDYQGMEIIPHEHPNSNNSNFNKNINEADMIFLLVSVRSINIDSWGKYANLAVKRQKSIRVVPLRIDDVSWAKRSFSKLQCLPRDKKSIEDRSRKNQKEPFYGMAEEIKKDAEEVIKSINSRELEKQEKQRQYNESIRGKELLFYEKTQNNLKLAITGGFILIVGILLLRNLFSASSVCSTTIKPEIYLQQAEAQEKDKNPQKAIEQYSCAIQFQPNNFEAYGKRGKIYFDQGNYEIAIDDFTKALEDKDLQTADLVFFLHRKGEANRKIWEINQNKQNKKDALENYDKAIELNKEYAYAYFGRGELYKSSGEKTLALSNFQRALFYFKENPNEKRNVKLAEEKIKELK